MRCRVCREGTALIRANATPTFAAARRRLLHASAHWLKVIPFNLPDIGEGIAEVEVLAWHVKAGDRVSQFDKLLEVQSDKATVDITSRYDGVVVALNYAVGQMAPTGKPLLTIDTGDGDAADSAASVSEGVAEDSPSDSVSTRSSGAAVPHAVAAGDADEGDGGAALGVRGLATPAVRRLAREHNLTVGSIRGTGKDGRVTKEDVLRHLDANPGAAESAVSSPRAAAAPTPAAPVPPHPAASSSQAVNLAATGAALLPPRTPRVDVRVPVKGIQRAMVKSMTAAWQAPHFGLSDEIVMDGLMDARRQLRPLADARGLKFSYLPLLLKAASLALSGAPSLNATIAPDASEVLHRGTHNIGVAMDTPRGLLVPNIKAVEQLSLLEIAAELARLQALAAAGKLGTEDLADGTFTLSNIGTIGGTYASPVLFAPQVAIGAIGKISRLPRYASTLPWRGAAAAAAAGVDALVPAHIMSVSWVADHRVVDGATLARFSNAFKGFVEAPTQMLAHLR